MRVCTHVRYLLIFVAGVILLPESLMAQPLGLQTGGIGEGFMFSAIGDLEVSTQLEYSNAFSKGTYTSLPRERLLGSTGELQVQNSIGYRASPHFLILGHLDGFFHNHRQELREGSWALRRDSSNYRLASSAVFDHGSVIFGGSIGLRFYGGLTRKLSYKEDDIDEGETTYQSDVSSVILPEGIVSVGYQYDNVTFLAQLVFPRSGDVVVEASHDVAKSTSAADDKAKEPTDASEESSSVSYDAIKKEPMRLSFNVLVDFLSEIQLASTFAYSFLKESSPDLYAWSMEYDGDYRALAEKSLFKDGMELSVGARYFATPDFSVAATFQYLWPSYAKKEYASVEEGNLGGYALNFEVEFVSAGSLRWHLATTYQPRTSVSFVSSSTTEDVMRHQVIAFDKPQKTTLTEGKYAFSFGIAYILGEDNLSVDDS